MQNNNELKNEKGINLEIRRICISDYEQLKLLFEQNNRFEITRHFRPFPLTEASARSIACEGHKDRYYIATLDDRIVGFCMLRGWEEGFELPSFGIFVGFGYQGRGFGRQMTEFAIAEAACLGCQKIRLSVFASDNRAIQLYSSLGFVEKSREKVFLCGEQDEKIIMIKELSGIKQ